MLGKLQTYSPLPIFWWLVLMTHPETEAVWISCICECNDNWSKSDYCITENICNYLIFWMICKDSLAKSVTSLSYGLLFERPWRFNLFLLLLNLGMEARLEAMKKRHFFPPKYLESVSPPYPQINLSQEETAKDLLDCLTYLSFPLKVLHPLEVKYIILYLSPKAIIGFIYLLNSILTTIYFPHPWNHSIIVLIAKPFKPPHSLPYLPISLQLII